MNLKFSTAVVVATRLVGDNGNKFSAFDVAQKLRQLVNDNDIALTDKTLEDVNGRQTYRIEVFDVKEVIQDYYEARMLSRTNNGRYYEYAIVKNWQPQVTGSTAPAALPTVPHTPHKPWWSSSVPLPPTVNVASPLKPVANVPAPSSSVLSPLNQKIQAYIAGRGKGSNVTMKQIQSRFDSVTGVTCGAYALHLEALGYKLNKPNTKTSEWSVLVS